MVSAYNDVGTGPTSDNRTQQTEQAEPTSSPENITFPSVEARSMIVAWEEVTHSGQNGPITGYLLYYTNTTFSDTINITGGENRAYTCLLYTSPSPRDRTRSRMPSSA